MKKTGNNVCAVCGWRHLQLPQRAASGGASHEICPACGFESGFTDDEQDFTYETWREQWVKSGFTWFSKGTPRPTPWNPMLNLRALLNRKRPVIPAIRMRRAAELRSDPVEPKVMKTTKKKVVKKAASKKKPSKRTLVISR